MFQRGGHTVSNIIVMAFSPLNIVGCLLKKGLQRGVTGTPGPPSLRPCGSSFNKHCHRKAISVYIFNKLKLTVSAQAVEKNSQ